MPSPRDSSATLATIATAQMSANYTTPLAKSSFDQSRNATITSILNTLTGPDTDGWYTTVPGINGNLAYPATSTMRAAAIEGYFQLDTPTAATGWRYIAADTPFKGIGTNVAQPRRQIVSLDKCNLCHERLGFHGERSRANDMDYCATCHNTEMSSSNIFAGMAADDNGKMWLVSQKPNNFKDMIHGIHSGCAAWNEEEGRCSVVTPREVPFNFIRGIWDQDPSGPAGVHAFQDVGYPARLQDCESCHIAGKYLLPINANALWTVVDAEPALTAAAPSNNALAKRIGPATSACVSCHDNQTARAHMEQNTSAGGESCNVCHGPDRTAPVAEAHQGGRYN